MADPIQNPPDAPSEAAAALYPEGAPNARNTPVEAAPATPEPAASAPSAGDPLPAEGDPAPEPAPPPPLTLESYEIKVPEDFQVEDTLLVDFKKAALDAGLPPGKAQAFVDLYANASRAQIAALKAEQEATQQRWTTELAGMPEFQGERQTQSLAVLGTAMREYGSPEATEFLNQSGAGNNPALVRYILKLAGGLAEGRVAPAGAPPASDRRTIGEVFYPTMKKAN